jgi:hypothetical protein
LARFHAFPPTACMITPAIWPIGKETHYASKPMLVAANRQPAHLTRNQLIESRTTLGLIRCFLTNRSTGDESLFYPSKVHTGERATRATSVGVAFSRARNWQSTLLKIYLARRCFPRHESIQRSSSLIRHKFDYMCIVDQAEKRGVVRNQIEWVHKIVQRCNDPH